MSKATDDPKLVARAQQGDRAAFEALMAQYHAAIASSVRLWINRREDAEDLLQQIYLRVWTDLRALRIPGSFRFWLLSLVRRRCQTFLRHKRRRELPASAEALEAWSFARERERAQSQGAASGVRESLEAAPRVLREVCERYYVQGFSVRETAQQLGVPEGTVKRRLLEARAFLKQTGALGPQGPRKEPQMKKSTTLEQALSKVRKQLKQACQAQYAGLLGREEIEAAIRRALKQYEQYCAAKARPYFNTVIKKRLLETIEGGAFPENAALEYFFELKKGIGCKGFSLGIEFTTPTEAFRGFSLPLVDVWYGNWGEESES